MRGFNFKYQVKSLVFNCIFFCKTNQKDLINIKNISVTVQITHTTTFKN